VRRASFLWLSAAALSTARARAQDDVDPARSASRQALRVLLGPGDAEPSGPQTFRFNGRLFRGSFERTTDGQVVNLVDLESYLYSVVPREMPSAWPAAALEAQAICARTYVLQRSDPRRAYDLIPSELDQRYDGIASESSAGCAGVDTTAGQVLWFGSGYAQIEYSSCCGGHTESSADAWGSFGAPYLAGVVCTNCGDSPNFRWQRSIALQSIAADLAQPLAPFGSLRDLQVVQRDASGRARTVELLTDRGGTTVAGSLFRRAVGARALPSLLLTDVVRSADAAQILFTGGGLGHGVGLCQWGARGMALSGRSARDVLAFYFPGTNVADLATNR
jgi:stage II sporulation protein D